MWQLDDKAIFKKQNARSLLKEALRTLPFETRA